MGEMEFTPRQNISFDAPVEGFEQILALSESVSYRKGEMVITGGMHSASVYYVEKGAVEVSYSSGNTDIVVALIGEGELFGEIGFFDGVSRVRNLRVTRDSTIRKWEREQLRKIEHQNPVLYGRFLTILARSICAKFRRVLEEREPLTAYAASLSTGRRTFQESRPLPDRFFQTSQWRFINSMVESVKAGFFDVSYELQKETAEEVSEEQRARCRAILQRLNDRLQECLALIDDPRMEEYAWGFIFKELFPYFMRSRFAERAYYKPKGYAGDFLMMEMIYRNQPDGDGKIGGLVDEWCLDTAAARAVRGRRKLLASLLEKQCSTLLANDKDVRILNLGCGSNRELFDFLARCNATDRIEAVCMDADAEALDYTNRCVNVFRHRSSIRFMQDNVVKWALGRVRHNFGLMDIIYSAGLTDYLDRRLFQALASRCFEHLKPGGVFIAGNFGPNNPNRAFMDHLLQWKLIYRDEAEIRDTLAATPFGTNVEILAETQQINLFAVSSRPSEPA